MKSFEELKVSTRTIIATTGIGMNTEEIFRRISMEERKVRGLKTIIDNMYYKNESRTGGKIVMEGREKQKSFRNALNVNMYVQNKKINFKLSKNGKFQMTGCRDIEYAKAGIISFLEAIHASCRNVLETEIACFRVYMEIVMTNMDCSAGYCINRQILDRLINEKTNFHSLLETSFGYTGVNIKIPVSVDLSSLMIPYMEWIPGDMESVRDDKISMSTITSKKTDKYNTFLVFHSGQFIMSGMFEDTMRDDYNRFIKILNDNESMIRECLEI